MKQPLGIVFICAVNALGGLLVLLAGLAIRSPLGVVLAVASLLVLLGVYGLWTFEAWGWALVVLMYALSIVVELVTDGTADPAGLFRLAVGAVILTYLYQRRDLYLSDEPPDERPNDEPSGEYGEQG